MKISLSALALSLLLVFSTLLPGCKKEPKEEGTHFYHFPGAMSTNTPAAAIGKDGSMAIGSSNGQGEMVVTKIGANNEILWHTNIGYSNNLVCTPVAVGQNGAVCAGKALYNSQTGYYNIRAYRLSKDGEITKETTITDSSLGFQKFEVHATTDGGYLFVISEYAPTLQLRLIKMNEDGTEQWDKSIYNIGYNAVAPQSDGSFVAICNGSVLLQFDSKGVVYYTNSTSFDPMFNDVKSIRKLPNGAFVVGGVSYSGTASVVKINADMTLAWNFSHPKPGETGSGSASSLALDGSGNIYVACDFTNSLNQMDHIIVKLDGGGNQLFLKKVGGDNQEWNVHILPRGNEFVIIGNTNSFNDQQSATKVYYTHIDTEGNFR